MEQAYMLRIDSGLSWSGRGPVVTVHSTQEEAEDALVEYVLTQLNGEVDIAEDEDSLVKSWFDESGERWSISKLSVRGRAGGVHQAVPFSAKEQSYEAG